MSAHICDCGNHYSSLGALEACQFNNHGDPRPVVAMPDLTAPLAQSIGIVRENQRLREEISTKDRQYNRVSVRMEKAEADRDHYKARCERMECALRRIGDPEFHYSSDDDDDTQESMRMADARAALKDSP